MPKISIITSVYNGEIFLSKAIESVLSQTFTDFEFLIYNDGSSDNTLHIIKQYKDNRIILFSDSQNKGLIHRLNFLIEKSTGQYIARIDADDIWYPEKLEKQMDFINNNNVDFVACYAKLIDSKGLTLKTSFKQYSNHDEIKKQLPNKNFIIHSSIIINKNLLIKLGKYTENYLYAEDYELWLKLLKQHIPINIIPENLLAYRISSYSVNYRYRKQQNKNVIRLKLNFWKQNKFKWFYIFELRKNFFYWLLPKWTIKLKRFFFNKNLF